MIIRDEMMLKLLEETLHNWGSNKLLPFCRLAVLRAKRDKVDFPYSRRCRYCELSVLIPSIYDGYFEAVRCGEPGIKRLYQKYANSFKNKGVEI